MTETIYLCQQCIVSKQFVILTLLLFVDIVPNFDKFLIATQPRHAFLVGVTRITITAYQQKLC